MMPLNTSRFGQDSLAKNSIFKKAKGALGQLRLNHRQKEYSNREVVKQLQRYVTQLS